MPQGFPRPRVLARLGGDRRERPGERRRQAAGVADDVPDHGGGRGAASRFGSGDSEIRVNKPVTLKPTFPRFLAVGDRRRSARSSPASCNRRQRGGDDQEPRSGRAAILGPSDADDARRGGGSTECGSSGRQGDRTGARADDREVGSETDAFEDDAASQALGVAGDDRGVRRGTTRRAAETADVPAGVVPGSAD